MKLNILIVKFLFFSSIIPLTALSAVNYGNGLPATDALGRALPMHQDVGNVRLHKQVGIFYWTWHTDGNATFSPVLNITQILQQYPSAATDANHSAWQGITGGVFWWDEPLFGYYRTTDEWVLRKHAEMLADAGIDVVFFDCTNGSLTWKSSYAKLLEVWEQARKDGVQTPQVAFLLPFSATDGSMASLSELYDELYKPQLYKDLWFMWNGKPLIMAYPNCLTANRSSAGLKFTATAPFYGVNATCPSWGNNVGNLTFRLYKWNNSYAETVAGPVIAEKTFVNFADNAKLTLTFEKQDVGTYLWELCNGTETVGVWKYTDTNGSSISYFNSTQTSGNYLSEIAYSSDLTFTPLTTGAGTTPVQVLSMISQQRIDSIKSFFTFRPGQPDYVNGPSDNQQWGWLENYPQHGYGLKSNGGYEEVTVGVAQNASSASGGHACGFNSAYTYGRSYTKANGQDFSTGAYVYGKNFQEQWGRARQLDPDLIFVTGWNEWIAGRWFDWDVKPFAFVDEYSAEKSRDIEPVKSWGNKGDVYYMQLVNNIRKYKGVPAEEAASFLATIDMNDRSFWNNVKPEFLSYKGNVLHRNHPGQGTSLVYTNNTGRNDIVKAKVARDKDYLYFYVETADALTDKSDPKWMRLFIDIDRNKNTGWEGYDFVLNRSNPSDSVSIEKSANGWNWSKVGAAGYAVNGSTLVFKVKRSLLGVAEEQRTNFEFKWSDNMQEDGNIMDFYVNGDVAPSGRFNYHYFVDTSTTPTQPSNVQFQIFPNPTADKLNVVLPVGIEKNAELSIYNSSGKRVWVKQLSDSAISESINLSFLNNKGMYIVELKTRGKLMKEKFIYR
ncbi:MAG: T9SS type A sorting domain-containing protein [Bacteroidota bacterium]|nr:T9SS type A sorting domain-containing protein [Bacteroidota bacterium]